MTLFIPSNTIENISFYRSCNWATFTWSKPFLGASLSGSFETPLRIVFDLLQLWIRLRRLLRLSLEKQGSNCDVHCKLRLVKCDLCLSQFVTPAGMHCKPINIHHWLERLSWCCTPWMAVNRAKKKKKPVELGYCSLWPDTNTALAQGKDAAVF